MPRRIPLKEKNFIKVIEIKDVKDKLAMQALLRGAEKLVLIKPFDKEAMPITQTYLEAAKNAGTVKHVILLSALGADTNSPFSIGKFQGNIEKLVEESGINYTHIRPVFFHSNILLSAYEIQHFGTFTDASKNGKQACIDTRDIASAIAVIATTPGHEKKAYTLAAEETALSSSEKIEILNKLLKEHNKHIKYNLVTREQYIANLNNTTLDEFTKGSLVDLQDIIAAGYGAPANSGDLKKLIGKPGITFGQWAKENINEFERLLK